MASGNDRLVFLALCVLDQAIDDASRGAVPKSPGLRLALGYLQSVGAFDRSWSDLFWHETTDMTAIGPEADAIGRRQHIWAAFRAIARGVSVELDEELLGTLRRARS